MKRDTYNLLSLLDPSSSATTVSTFIRFINHRATIHPRSRFTLIFRVAKIGDQTDKGIELSGVECHEGEILRTECKFSVKTRRYAFFPPRAISIIYINLSGEEKAHR